MGKCWISHKNSSRFRCKIKIIKRTISKIRFEGRVQFIKGKLTKKSLKN